LRSRSIAHPMRIEQSRDDPRETDPQGVELLWSACRTPTKPSYLAGEALSCVTIRAASVASDRFIAATIAGLSIEVIGIVIRS